MNFTFLYGFDSVEKRTAFLREMSRQLQDMTDELYSGTVVKLSASAGAGPLPRGCGYPHRIDALCRRGDVCAKRKGKGMIELFDAARDCRLSVYLTDLEKLNRFIDQRMVRFCPSTHCASARAAGV